MTFELDDIPLVKMNSNRKLETTIMSHSLWEERPVVLLIVRRAGCLVCRDDAKHFNMLREQFSAYNFSLVAVTHHRSSWETYKNKYFKGDVYLDEGRRFYKALGKNKYRKANIFKLFAPQLWKTMISAYKNGCRDGMDIYKSRIMGGAFIISKAGVHLAYLENYEVLSPHQEFLDMCKKVYESKLLVSHGTDKQEAKEDEEKEVAGKEQPLNPIIASNSSDKSATLAL